MNAVLEPALTRIETLYRQHGAELAVANGIGLFACLLPGIEHLAKVLSNDLEAEMVEEGTESSGGSR